MNHEAILWGVAALLAGFLLNGVIAPLVPRNKYVTQEACEQCQKVRAAERDAVMDALRNLQEEMHRMRDAIHALRNSLVAPEVLEFVRQQQGHKGEG